MGFEVGWGCEILCIQVPRNKGLVAPGSGCVLGKSREGAVWGPNIGWTKRDDGGEDVVVLLELFVDLLGGEGGEVGVLIGVGADKVAGVLHVGEDGGVGCDGDVYVIGYK